MNMWDESKEFSNRSIKWVTCGTPAIPHSEHQELMGQIDATQQSKQRQDLQRELERLVTRMEEKGAQITKLRKHQQTVCELSGSTIEWQFGSDGQLQQLSPHYGTL